MALTDKEIQSLKPKEKKYKVFDGDGLYLLVHPRGWKYWYMKYHIAARPHEVSFGAYPAVTLKLARERRDDAREQLARGLNASLEKKAAREASSLVFQHVANEWLEMMATPARMGTARADLPSIPKPKKKHRWLVDAYLAPALGKWPMAQISTQQLLPVLTRIEEAGKYETAHRVRSLASRIFCYAHSTAVRRW